MEQIPNMEAFTLHQWDYTTVAKGDLTREYIGITL
jgi:hypothetical protein